MSRRPAWHGARNFARTDVDGEGERRRPRLLAISGAEATRKSLSSLTAEHAILQEQLDVLSEERDAAHAALAREQASAARRRRAHEDGLASARAAADEARASVCGLEAELHAEALRREEAERVAAARETQLGVLQGTLAALESQQLELQAAVDERRDASRTLQLQHLKARQAGDRDVAAAAVERRAERARAAREAEGLRDQLAAAEAELHRERAARRAGAERAATEEAAAAEERAARAARAAAAERAALVERARAAEERAATAEAAAAEAAAAEARAAAAQKAAAKAERAAAERDAARERATQRGGGAAWRAGGGGGGAAARTGGAARRGRGGGGRPAGDPRVGAHGERERGGAR